MTDLEILGELFFRIRTLYAKERCVPGPDLEAHLAVRAEKPSAEEMAREYNGWALADLPDPKDKTKIAVKRGDQLDLRPAHRRRLDGGGLLDLHGQLHRQEQHGPPRHRRSERARDHALVGVGVAAQPAHPLQRRVLRSDRQALGSAPHPRQVERREVGGARRADFKVQHRVRVRDVAVHHEPGGHGAALRRRQDGGGPFPEHYEPFESPLAKNPIHERAVASTNPAARIYAHDKAALGTSDKFPYAATTYRLTSTSTTGRSTCECWYSSRSSSCRSASAREEEGSATARRSGCARTAARSSRRRW